MEFVLLLRLVLSVVAVAEVLAPLLSALRRAARPGTIPKGDRRPQLEKRMEVRKDVIDGNWEEVQQEVEGLVPEVPDDLHQLGEVDPSDEKAEKRGLVGRLGAYLRLGEGIHNGSIPHEGEVEEGSHIRDPYRHGPLAPNGAVGDERANVGPEGRAGPAQALLRKLGEHPKGRLNVRVIGVLDLDLEVLVEYPASDEIVVISGDGAEEAEEEVLVCEAADELGVLNDRGQNGHSPT